MEERLAAVPVATQAGEIRARWAWVEPAVWTDRMLTALETGVKEGVWPSALAELVLYGAGLVRPENSSCDGESALTKIH